MPKLARGSSFNLTTLTLRNLPHWATESEVIAEVREAMPEAQVDFVYMPSDAAGEAIVNFSDTATARAAYVRLNRRQWSQPSPTPQLVEVRIAHVQGLVPNLRHLTRGAMHDVTFRPPVIVEGGKRLAFDIALLKYCPGVSVDRAQEAVPRQTMLFQADTASGADFFEHALECDAQADWGCVLSEATGVAAADGSQAHCSANAAGPARLSTHSAAPLDWRAQADTAYGAAWEATSDASTASVAHDASGISMKLSV